MMFHCNLLGILMTVLVDMLRRKGREAPVIDSQRSHTTKAMTHEREEVLNQTNNINKNKFISFQEDV